MLKRNPIFTFENLLSTGINKIPLDSIITVDDFDGSGNSRSVVVKSISGMTGSSTISDFLANTVLFKEVGDNGIVEGGSF